MKWNENPDPISDLLVVVEQTKNTGLVLRKATLDDLRMWASSYPLGWLWVRTLKKVFDHQYREGIDENKSFSS